MRYKTNKTTQLCLGLIGLWVIISLACSGPGDLFGSSAAEEIGGEKDMRYPEADLLFEVIPFGFVIQGNYRHAIRWQVYTSDMAIDAVADYYASVPPGWEVIQDEVINDFRYMAFSGDHPLRAVIEEATFEQQLQTHGTFEPALLDVEVLNSTAHTELGRLKLIFERNYAPVRLPEDEPLRIPHSTTLIIIAEYFKQDLEATATPEVEGTPEPTKSDTSEDEEQLSCQAALESSLCMNPYFPPIEGLTLTYLIDGNRTQTRQIGPVQTGVQEPGEPQMDRFTVNIIDDQFSGELEIFCTEEGVVGGDSSSLIANVLANQATEEGVLEVVSTTLEGVTLPHDISPGDTWESSVEVVISASDGVLLVSTGRAQYFFEGYEKITSPVGTFEAQKIHMDMVVEVVAKFPTGDVIPLSSVNIVTVNYNVACIGMVRSEGDTSLELVDYSLP